MQRQDCTSKHAPHVSGGEGRNSCTNWSVEDEDEAFRRVKAVGRLPSPDESISDAGGPLES